MNGFKFFAFAFGLTGCGALYGAIFMNATHQYGVAAICAVVTTVAALSVPRTKNSNKNG